MRIGMILDKTFPPDPRVENEAISLINSGHEVFLFCLKYSKFEQDEIIKGIQVKRYQSNKTLYKLSALVYTFPFYTQIMLKKIQHFLKKYTIEAIHIHDIQIAEATFKANKNLKLPITLDLHENRPEIMKYYPHLNKFPGKNMISVKKWKQKEEEFVDRAKNIIVVTKEAKEELINRTNKTAKNIIVVPNTVHKSFYKNATIEKDIIEKYKHDFVLLYIGDTGLRRGLQTAIESISNLKEEIKNIKLVVVGSNSSDVILKNQVNDLKISDFVVFEGWQNEIVFPSFITASAICISPLHKNLHHNTTYANKLFQYMSFAKPLIVSDVTAQKNIITEANSGLVHIAESSTDFSKKVLALHANQDLCKQLGENGKQFVENKFHWEKTSEKLIDLYLNLSK